MVLDASKSINGIFFKNLHPCEQRWVREDEGVDLFRILRPSWRDNSKTALLAMDETVKSYHHLKTAGDRIYIWSFEFNAPSIGAIEEQQTPIIKASENNGVRLFATAILAVFQLEG